jgi:5-methyltetrahydropteroyltriglutamate--homocysteine methyltransferase
VKRSTDRILTSHVGSLPRSQAVTDVIFAKHHHGEDIDQNLYDTTIHDAVVEVVQKQVDTGIDVVSDGEMSKISYATYIADRLTGFDGDTPREPGQDLVEVPNFLKKLADSGATAKYRRPRCVGEITVKQNDDLQKDIDNMKEAVSSAGANEGFINAASPGVIALFQPNDYYPTQDEYLEALAEGMRAEYEAITNAGLLLQIDAPDFGMGRHTMYRDRSVADYLVLVEKHVEVLNHALRNVDPAMVRMHMCWGNYEGPHHHDVDMKYLMPVMLKVNVGALLFEGANPRHAHEWEDLKEMDIPEDKILVPGVLDTTCNYIEHPRLVAQRICRYADIVGRERVIAGTDCGFGTFAGFGPVEPDIVYMKLGALVEGAELASKKLWG